MDMGKWSSSPRPVRVTPKAEPAMAHTFASVAAAGRAMGISRNHVHGMLSGRTGRRSPFAVEYADGGKSKRKAKRCNKTERAA